MMKLIFASNNEHKLNEIRSMISKNVELGNLKDIECTDDLPETSDTLQGNALEKAKYIHDKYDVNCFADDTGLEVEALGGRPGVYSARYAGPNCLAEDNITKLLEEMEGVKNRKARFRTVIAAIIDGEISYFEGIVEGEISLGRSGGQGFGYDPVFKPIGSSISFAEMTMDDKNAISHRGRALRKFISALEKY